MFTDIARRQVSAAMHEHLRATFGDKGGAPERQLKAAIAKFCEDNGVPGLIEVRITDDGRADFVITDQLQCIMLATRLKR